MAKFNAGVAVEKLEYDFTDFGGKEGVVPEPSIAQTNAFFKNMKGLVKNVKSLKSGLGDLELEELSDDDMIDQMGKVDELEAEVSEFQAKSIEYLAELCSHTPSVDELSALPYRVLQAFSTWLVQEIQPKRTTPASKR